MVNLFQPVLADLAGLIQIIIFLVILASGVAKLFRESKEAQPAPRPRPRRRPPLDPLEEPEPNRPPQGRPRREAIQSEVDEFLRRVEDEPSERPVGRPVEARQPPPVPRRQPQIEILDDDGGIEIDPRPRQSRRRSRPAEPPRSQPKPQPEPLVLRGESVAEHVEIHLNEDQFKERASHLGEKVAHSDDRLEARLQETFDHGLGSLSARRQAREQADAAKKKEADQPDMAESLLNLLSSPAGVQQAVILNEVLRRPEDRI